MKYKLLILFNLVYIISYSQYYNITKLENKNSKIQAYNSFTKQVFEVNCKDAIWYEQPDGKIII